MPTIHKFYYDTETRNESFLSVSEQLKSKGIKNNKFMLIIYDKDLIGVDPYNPNLDLTTKKKILVECMQNPWYYFRNIARIPINDSIEGVPFELTLESASKYYLALLNFSVATCTSRDCFRDISNIILLSYIYIFESNISISLLSKRLENSKYILQQIKDVIKFIPYYINSIVSIKQNSNNVENISNTNNNNCISVESSASSENKAIKLGNSLTSQIDYFNEATFMNYLDKTFYASSPVYHLSHYNALRNNKHSFRLFDIYYGDLLGDVRVQNSYHFVHNCALWDETMFDLSKEDLDKYIRISANGVIYVEYHWRELGRSIEWYNNICKRLKNDRIVIAHEVDLVYTNGDLNINKNK